MKSEVELNREIPAATARFRQMLHATADDYARIHAAEAVLDAQLPERLLEYLSRLEVSNGTTLSILQHSLLTATLAAEDGRDDEYIACALVHDIGDLLCPADHGAFAAAIVRPYVSEAHWFMTRYHPVFQMANQPANSRADTVAYREYATSPHFDLTVEFCRRYDQRAFDPDLPTMMLAEFQPVLHRVFDPGRVRRSADCTPASA